MAWVLTGNSVNTYQEYFVGCLQKGDSTLKHSVNLSEKEMATHSRFLPGEFQGQRSLVGCHLWGHTESDTTEVT